MFPVHPCDKESKGGCAQTCNKGEGEEFTCSCETPDFKLNEDDGKTCDKGIGFFFLENTTENIIRMKPMKTQYNALSHIHV